MLRRKIKNIKNYLESFENLKCDYEDSFQELKIKIKILNIVVIIFLNYDYLIKQNSNEINEHVKSVIECEINRHIFKTEDKVVLVFGGSGTFRNCYD